MRCKAQDGWDLLKPARTAKQIADRKFPTGRRFTIVNGFFIAAVADGA
jgi:hypothetical protein